MTKKQKLSQAGVLKDGMTGNQQDTPSTNAENPSISVTLATTPPKKTDSPAIPNSPNANPNVVHSRIVQVFGEKLVKAGMCEWRRVLLTGGQEAFALCFLTDKWLVDPVTKELTPL